MKNICEHEKLESEELMAGLVWRAGGGDEERERFRSEATSPNCSREKQKGDQAPQIRTCTNGLSKQY
ncbi:hypothetical protein RRG08_054671 [Elysia crispata]|uniref:Uncharacterized protein n=1 Tax=Elysia crispata TaxID=231223 RepID=A0AAE1B0Y6_9GAST|nr:hypothetical protein RRG08_054671 [Elysia crispata]